MASTAKNRRHSLLSVLAAGVLVLAAALVGCGRDDPLNEPQEAFENVEVDHGRAIRTSLAEITGSELVSVELQRPESIDPVWLSTVATQQGQTHTVSVDATNGDVLGTAPARLNDTERTELLRRLDEATILPEEAAREARGSTDGPVTAIELRERDGEAVWAVDVSDVAGGSPTTHFVDARTGKVLSRS